MDGWDQGRLFYLILLLLLVSGSVLYGRRESFSKTLQQALVWLGIFVFAIIGYGFRDTLTGQLFTGYVRQVDPTTVALFRTPSGSFEAVAQVNGVDVNFLIDTGATSLVLSRQDAERAGIDLARLDFSGQALTANGSVPTAPVRIASFRFGDFADTDVRASVNGGALDTSLLGMSYLSRFEKIEIEGDRMTLTRR